MTSSEKLRRAFAEGLGVEESKITDSLTYGNPGWDSVAHMALIASIERAFDIMLETDDVIAMSSFGVAKTIVAKNGIDFDAAG